jgi:methionyl-tRNA synthetase
MCYGVRSPLVEEAAMTVPHSYITTTLPYVNARPHMGHALELVQADVLARFRVAEENWFFRLSRYGQRLREAISRGELRIEPSGRRHEVLAFIDGGLEDFSVSRPAERSGGCRLHRRADGRPGRRRARQRPG